jgi:hypothetical protein
MCERFTLRRDLESIHRELRVEAGSGAVLWSPRYNIAPTDQVPILNVAESGHRQPSRMPGASRGTVAGGWSGKSTRAPRRSPCTAAVAPLSRMAFTNEPAPKARIVSLTSFIARTTL